MAKKWKKLPPELLLGGGYMTDTDYAARVGLCRKSLQRYDRDPVDPLPVFWWGGKKYRHVERSDRWLLKRAERATQAVNPKAPSKRRYQGGANAQP